MGAGSLAALGVGVLQSGFNAWLGDEMQNRYMMNWGGPEAQMEHMRAAGVNPFTAAGNLSGAAGDTNVGSTIGGYDLNNSIAALANSQMNPTVEDNTKSGTKKNDADAKVSETVAEGQKIQNEINSDTKESQKQEIRDRALKMGYDADVAEVTALYADDIEKATLDNLDADYNLKVKQHEQATKQIELIGKEIKQIDQNINVLKEQVRFYKSQEELNNAQKLLAEENKKKAEKETEKLQIENDILENSSGEDLTGQYYRIRKKYGKDYADQWIKDAKQNIRDQKEAEVTGATIGQKEVETQYSFDANQQRAAVQVITMYKNAYDAVVKMRDEADANMAKYSRGSKEYNYWADAWRSYNDQAKQYEREFNKIKDDYLQYRWWNEAGGKNATIQTVGGIIGALSKGL